MTATLATVDRRPATGESAVDTHIGTDIGTGTDTDPGTDIVTGTDTDTGTDTATDSNTDRALTPVGIPRPARTPTPEGH